MSAAFFAQLKDLATRVAELEKQLAEAQQRIAMLEAKRGPGRPPNQVAA